VLPRFPARPAGISFQVLKPILALTHWHIPLGSSTQQDYCQPIAQQPKGNGGQTTTGNKAKGHLVSDLAFGDRDLDFGDWVERVLHG
jgi:hypothetical protein